MARLVGQLGLISGFSILVGCSPAVVVPPGMEARDSGSPDVWVPHRDGGRDGGGVFPDVEPLPNPCGAVDASVDAVPLHFGTTVTTDRPPPAISGGTLLVTHDDHYAIASDPNRDLVWVVDLMSRVPVSIALTPGDEPGRLAEDARGVIHVSLRRGGAIVDIEPATQSIIARRPVCAAPRGIAYQASTDSLLVACVSGSLVTLPAAGGAPNGSIYVADDLRDVVVDASGRVFASTFRAAQLFLIPPGGTPTLVSALPSTTPAAPQVAWRTIANGTTVYMLHQLESELPVCPAPGGYSGMLPIVQPTVTQIDLGLAIQGPSVVPAASLVVDMAVGPTGSVAFASAGASADTPMLRPVVLGDVQSSRAGADAGSPNYLQFLPSAPSTTGQVIAVAFRPSGALMWQTEAPSSVVILTSDGVTSTAIALGAATDQEDTGHAIFHRATGAGLTCAGCHPEGGDDGHIWNFNGLGARRTQNIRGGIATTAPYHWDGRFATFDALQADVYHGRMSGPVLTPDQSAALLHWVNLLPEPGHDAPVDPASVARGQAVFNDPSVGCIGCHSGPQFTNNTTVDVGTGGAFQVPSLTGVAFRAPYLHNGCAPDLMTRLTNAACGGGDNHGRTSGLTPGQRQDLVAYLQTL